MPAEPRIPLRTSMLEDASRVRPVRCIQVKVTPELTLDFGSAEPCERAGKRGILLRPAATPPMPQLMTFLESQPDPGKGRRTARELEALAATALTVRWGSYYAVLADIKHQLWRFDGSISEGIYQEEMARINIEASAAMGRWIEIYLSDRYRERASALARRAVAYLPLCKQVNSITGSFYRVTAEQARTLIAGAGPERQLLITQAAEASPWRILGNAFIHAAYRNGPIETVHGGPAEGQTHTPRLTPPVDRLIQAETHGRMKLAHDLLWHLEEAPGYGSWSERAAPYWFTAQRWSTTEDSREVFLPYENQSR